MTQAKWLLLLGMFLVTTGCNSQPSGELSGRVTYQGEPLTSGSITFVPQAAGAPYAHAEIDSQGNYVATTEEHGKRIPLGSYRVMISAVKDMGPEAPVEPLLPMKYSSDAQSGLTAEVQEGTNTVNFDLQ